jgi:sporulation protein YlmC with PRC-barrel domain
MAMSRALNNSWQGRQDESYTDIGDYKTAVRVADATVSTNQLAITGESVSFSAGAAGTTGVVALDKAAIYDSTGSRLGKVGDTSFAWVTGTVLTTEVVYRRDLTDSAQFALMSNGQYAVDYDIGRIRYKKATVGVSDTCNYTTRQINIEITAGTATLTIGEVIVKATAPQAYGEDATGQDAYATVLTTTTAKSHMHVSLAGSNDAVISIDGGAADHFVIPANSSHVFDNLLIAATTNIQAKNKSAGNNYTNLRITVW